jgi:hypothetical protein
MASLIEEMLYMDGQMLVRLLPAVGAVRSPL